MLTSKSRIFEHVETIASYCDEVPAQIKYDTNLNTVHVITAVGNQYNVFSLAKLAKLYVSDVLPSKITCIAAHEYTIACVCGKKVHICVRGKVSGSYENHESYVVGVLFIGDYVVSWDTDSEVHVYHKVTCEPHTQLSLAQPGFTISKIIHPMTYLNKLLIGSNSGQLQLWNIKTTKLVHSFQSVAGMESEITYLCQSPVVDVVGAGYGCGSIVLINIKTDKVIMKFNQNHSKVTALSFRLDDSPVLICSTSDGSIGCWNLNEKSLQSIIRDDSDDTTRHPITGLHCVQSQNLMITSSGSNCLRLWIFDSKDGTAPRVLIERFGHSKGGIRKIKWYDEQTLLSCGSDGSVKKLSLEHERHSRNLGRSRITTGKHTKLSKDTVPSNDVFLGPASDMACEVRRQSDWDSAVTCHENSEIVCSWNVYKSTIGSHRLKPLPNQGSKQHSFRATCVQLTSCGNFCLVGYSDGSVNKYNIQSGQHRGYISNNNHSTQSSLSHAHSCVGIGLDNVNTKVIVARNCFLSFYDFVKLKLIGERVELMEQIEFIRVHRESCLMVAALIDFTIEVVDYVSQQSVRKFNQSTVSCHVANILDIVFTPDSRWIVSCSLDCTIRVWNISTCTLIDCFTTENPAASITFSTSSDVLSVAFLHSIGVAILSNISLYRPVDLSPYPLTFDPFSQNESVSVFDAGQTDSDSFESPLLIANMKSLSVQSEGTSKWQTLLKHDVIKERNKPREPPKVPKSAPFFMPTVAGLEFQLDTEEAKKLLSNNRDTKTTSLGLGNKKILEDSSVLVKMMMKEEENGEKQKSQNIISFLQDKSPAAIDFEIFSLSESQGGSLQMICNFLNLLLDCLKTGSNLDGCHAMLQIVLKHHGPDIMLHKKVFENVLSELRVCHEDSWNEVSKNFQLTAAVAAFLRSALV